ncbi:MAG: MinD/ParA family protein [Gammaproteobacteria bacterium]|nr:MinD/ParA family protein [Gammaproteobacteria bacterium]
MAGRRESDSQTVITKTGPLAGPARDCSTVVLISGSDGIGKSTVLANLGFELSQRDQTVTLLDGCQDQISSRILLGMSSGKALEEFLGGSEKEDINHLFQAGVENTQVLVAPSGLEFVADLDSTEQDRMSDVLDRVEQSSCFFLIDTASDDGEGAITIARVCSRIVIFVTKEPTSLTGAFTLLRKLKLLGPLPPVSVVANLVKDRHEAREAIRHFSGVVRKYLGIKVHALGFVTKDPLLADSVSHGQPLGVLYPTSSIAGRCIKHIAGGLLDLVGQDPQDESLSGRFRSLFWNHESSEEDVADDNSGGVAFNQDALSQLSSAELEELIALATEVWSGRTRQFPMATQRQFADMLKSGRIDEQGAADLEHMLNEMLQMLNGLSPRERRQLDRRVRERRSVERRSENDPLARQHEAEDGVGLNAAIYLAQRLANMDR